MMFLKEFFGKDDFENSQQTTTKAWEITQHAMSWSRGIISFSIWIHYVDETSVDPDHWVSLEDTRWSGSLLDSKEQKEFWKKIRHTVHLLGWITVDFLITQQKPILTLPTSVVCWCPLQTVWTQIGPYITSGLIWIQNVWHSDGIPERIFRKRWFWKNHQTTIKHAKLPRRQLVTTCTWLYFCMC